LNIVQDGMEHFNSLQTALISGEVSPMRFFLINGKNELYTQANTFL